MELRNQLKAAGDIFRQKEAIESQMREENILIRFHEYKLNTIQKRIDVDKLNAYDRGNIRGRRFRNIGWVQLIAYTLICILIAVANRQDFDITYVGGMLAGLLIAAQPMLVGQLLYLAYSRTKKRREEDAVVAKEEYEVYKRDTADPETKRSQERIAELEEQLMNLLEEHKSAIKFLPTAYWNADAADFMMNAAENGNQDNLEALIRKCKRAKVVKKHERAIAEQEKSRLRELGVCEESVQEIRPYGTVLAYVVADSIFDSIF